LFPGRDAIFLPERGVYSAANIIIRWHKSDFLPVEINFDFPGHNMTLQEFFNYLDANPLVVLFFFIGIPLTALLANVMGRGEGHLSPWKYFYAVLVFAACIPGIFAAALAVYMFLFERGSSIFNVNLLTQALPIVSMIVTLAIVRRNAPFEYIPGFGKLSSLMMMIAAIFILMFLLDRVRIIAWVNIPVHYLLLIVVGLLLTFRIGLKKMIS